MANASNIGLFDRMVAQAVPLVPSPIVRRLGAPYVGGTTLEQALSLIANLHRQQFETTVDVLGESVDNLATRSLPLTRMSSPLTRSPPVGCLRTSALSRAVSAAS
ncbi:MAG: hypothetical protein ACLQUT_11080 [Thermoleophilia bacterium]